jgi:hypothetical protein
MSTHDKKIAKLKIDLKLLENCAKPLLGSSMVEWSFESDGLYMKNYTPEWSAYFSSYIAKDLFIVYELYEDTKDECGEFFYRMVVELNTLISALGALKASQVEVNVSKYALAFLIQGKEMFILSTLSNTLKSISKPVINEGILKISEKVLNMRLKLMKRINPIIKFELNESQIKLYSISQNRVNESEWVLTKDNYNYVGTNLSVKLDCSIFLEKVLSHLQNAELKISFKGNAILFDFIHPSGFTGYFLLVTIRS